MAHIDHLDSVVVNPTHKLGLQALFDLLIGKLKNGICDLVLYVWVLSVLDHPTLILKIDVDEFFQIWRKKFEQDRCIELSKIEWSLSQCLDKVDFIEPAGEFR